MTDVGEKWEGSSAGGKWHKNISALLELTGVKEKIRWASFRERRQRGSLAPLKCHECCQTLTKDCQIPTKDCQTLTKGIHVPNKACQMLTKECKIPKEICQALAEGCQMLTKDCQMLAEGCQRLGEECQRLAKAF